MHRSWRAGAFRSITMLALGAVVAFSLAEAAALTTGLGLVETGAQTGTVRPNPVGGLDCNHYSTIQQSVSPKLLCADIRGIPGRGNANSWSGRFFDNGHYIGHDEPIVTFLSDRPGSGNNVVWDERLGLEPAAAPTVGVPGHDVTHTFELTIAPWFSMALCDPNSYPQMPCTPESDANAPAKSCMTSLTCHSYPGAGSAFLELQFYPPGMAPFVDNVSCDNVHWCAAMVIWSLACTQGFANCNPGCVEPGNFAFLSTDGVPAGPPSPQLANLATYTPNRSTLRMNPGDRLSVHIYDAPTPGGGKALKTVVTDLTTGKTGFMQASAANGFMHTSIVDCSGTPFNFQPEYSTAKRFNIVPWAADQTDIGTEFEIGHFTACWSLTGPQTYSIQGDSDTYYLHCHGPYEQAAPGGDGGKAPEQADALCYYRGDRHLGLPGPHAPNQVTSCLDNWYQNGDLDFDGSPYWPDWPTSVTPNRFPATFLQQPPSSDGAPYGRLFFQTDTALSESTCTASNPAGCGIPPPNAPGKFYPFWTQTQQCVWEFGNMHNGNTFGGDAQYGSNRSSEFGYPQFIGPILPNACSS